MKLLQRLNDEEVHGKPYGPAPVRVAAEQARARLGRFVVQGKRLSVRPKDERGVEVIAGDRAYTVVRQKFVGIEHPAQQRLHAMAAQQRKQPALSFAREEPVRYQLGQVGTVSE